MNETRSHSQREANGADDVPHFSNRRHRRGRNRNGHWRPPNPQVNGDVRPMLLDTWALAETVLKRWYWLFLGALLCGALGAFAGWTLWQPYYLAVSKLIRFEQQNSAEFFKYREITQPTFISILQSPELIERVSRKAGISSDDLKNRLLIAPERESDVVSIEMTGDTGERAVDLANLYATNATEFFRDMQRREANNDHQYLTNQLQDVEKEIATLNTKLKAAPTAETKKMVGPDASAQRLAAAEQELAALRRKFTDMHPEVIAKIQEVERLRAEVQKLIEQQAGKAEKPGGGIEEDVELLRARLSMLMNSQIMLVSRAREAAQFVEKPPGYCREFALAELHDATFVDPKPKIIFLGIVGGVAGIGGAILLILLFELFDNRLKTVADLKRVTKLPVIATLGNLDKMHPSAQSGWAFRTWTALQSRLSLSPNHGLVCGFTSSGGGQGRSTWIRLLAKAASQCGFRVLTIATLPSPPFMQPDHQEEPVESGRKESDMNDNETSSPFGDEPSMAVANNVLSTPMEVTEKLTGENPQPLVHIPLPGWVWSLERRKQWQSALKQWRNIENIVILVELPPACDPEAVLLAENIPNVIWLADGNKADASESREQLQTLRDARCNLVGSVMNRAPAATRMKKRFSRWVGVWPLLAGICLAAAQNAGAQANAPATPAPPANAATNELVFSGSASTHRAEWQKRLTLGPGDTLNISLYGDPTLSRLEVVIGPDGQLNYLQATVMATGLTVDELRAKLDEQLATFYRAPRTIIVPSGYRSKKYYVLGTVVNKGVFTLERPITILEAVARARGLETGLLENQNSFDLADLQRSFIVRGNKRLEVNFEKLFMEGDLTQNVAVEPEDYLFFAAGNLKEVYVLGQVRIPGVVIHDSSTTVMSAIAQAGSYTDKAFKSRVLVVRGSLNNPKTFVVDTWATLDARGLDFKLEPKDIVYISARPFIRVEEVLDLAATAFIQSAVTTWSGKFIGPLITHPILPQP